MELRSPVLKMLRDKYKYDFKDELYRTARTVIYDIGNDKILKITSEKNEAIAASIIKKHTLKNVVRVYRVFTTNNKHFEKYYIEEEKLDKIGFNEEYDEIYEYLIEKQNNETLFYNDKTEAFWRDNKTFDSYNEDEKDFICYLSNKENWIDKELEIEKFHLKFKRFQKQFNDLLNGIEELKKIGIEFYDIHSKNVMKNGSIYKFVDIPWHGSTDKIEVLSNKNMPIQISESKIRYAKTEEQKARGLKNIELEDWGGIMVFTDVKEGDVFVGEDCLFDIRIAFLDSTEKVLSIGIIKKGTGRVSAPKNTVKAIETAASDDYQIIKGSIFKIPASEPNFASISSKF